MGLLTGLLTAPIACLVTTDVRTSFNKQIRAPSH